MLFAPVHIHICDYMIDIWKRRVGGTGKKEQHSMEVTDSSMINN